MFHSDVAVEVSYHNHCNVNDIACVAQYSSCFMTPITLCGQILWVEVFVCVYVCCKGFIRAPASGIYYECIVTQQIQTVHLHHQLPLYMKLSLVCCTLELNNVVKQHCPNAIMRFII